MMIPYGVMLLFPFLLSLLASKQDYARHVDALFASGMLAAIWAFTNIIAVLWEFPHNKIFHPMVDLIALSIVIAAYMTQRQRWKLTLAWLFFAQLCTHAVFWWSLSENVQIVSGRDYVGLLNLIWFAQLICVATPGGGYVATRALHWLRDHRGLFPLAWH